MPPVALLQNTEADLHKAYAWAGLEEDGKRQGETPIVKRCFMDASPQALDRRLMALMFTDFVGSVALKLRMAKVTKSVAQERLNFLLNMDS